MSKKPVIIFEGVEGSGKTFHINNVAKYLKNKKIDFIKIREPGGSKNSEKIRKLILNKKSNFFKDTDLLLYLASRNENLNQLRKIVGLKFNRVLFDNMTSKNLRKGVKISKKLYETEASGGITLKNVRKIASTGVKRVSVGKITHSAPSIDFKLEL